MFKYKPYAEEEAVFKLIVIMRLSLRKMFVV